MLLALPYSLPASADTAGPQLYPEAVKTSQSIPVGPSRAQRVDREQFSVTEEVPEGYRVYAQTADTFVNSPDSPVQWPFTQGVPISSGFGYRSCAGCSSYHDGLDMNPGFGTPVGAIADGVVDEVGGPAGTMGAFVTVIHDIDGQKVVSIYAHMIPGSSSLREGDNVTVGQEVGLVGQSGKVTGPHLHYGIRIDGSYVDPFTWTEAHVVLR